ncbi:MAG: hypothetical protein H7144_07935 [Burkholderiales bacterium]|nr:hypothetical protein [Phycisphaerae bacterium]
MRRIAAILIVSTAALTGCASNTPPANSASAPTASEAVVIRQSIQTNHPKARVGVITAVLDMHPLAMVGEIDVTGLQSGDAVTILDSAENVVSHGRIVQLMADKVAIRFADGVRMPAVGDIVVRF